MRALITALLAGAVLATPSAYAQGQEPAPTYCGGPAGEDDFEVPANDVSACEVDPLLAEAGNAIGIVRNETLIFGIVPRAAMTGMSGTWVDIESDPAASPVEISRYEFAPNWRIPALREDITPISGDRVIRVVKGDQAWNEGPEPGLNPMEVEDPAILALRKARVWLSPHAIVRAAAFAQKGLCPTNDAQNSDDVTECPDNTVTINGADGFSVVLDGNEYAVTLGEEEGIKGYVTSISVTVGGMQIVSTYSGYHDGKGTGDDDTAAIQKIGFGTSEDIAAATDVVDEFRYGVYYPTHITETVNGNTTLDVSITSGWTNKYIPFPDPDKLRAAAAQ